MQYIKAKRQKYIADPTNSNNYSCSSESDTQHGRTEADRIFLGIYAQEWKHWRELKETVLIVNIIFILG